MQQFLETILQFFNTAAEVVQSFFVGIVQMLATIPRAVSVFNYCIHMLPGTIAVFAAAFVGCSVIYLIIGRNS